MKTKYLIDPLNPHLPRREALRLVLAGSVATLLRPAWGAPPPGTPGRSVIQIWLWGGASHIDTFDPKPDADSAFTGTFRSPIPTRTPGLLFCEKLPELAKRSHLFSVIRSMSHGVNAHEVASYLVQSGWPKAREVHPCIGAVFSKMRGVDNGYDSCIPPYIVISQAQGRFSEAGFLGRAYQPFATGGDPARDPFAVDGIVSRNLTRDDQLRRRRLLESIDQFYPDHPLSLSYARAREEAYEMILGEKGQVFDLSREPADLRERYGRNTFGQSCLAARRLVEAGVPYITVNAKGWDTHKKHFPEMEKKLPELDQGLSTLFDDLQERGLLDSTVVWCSGEFGRTPKVQYEAPWNGGRGHYGKCYSALIGGAGFAGGRVLGATDKNGESVIERPVAPDELLAAIYRQCGIDPYALLPNDVGRTTTVLPVPAEPQGAPLPELL